MKCSFFPIALLFLCGTAGISQTGADGQSMLGTLEESLPYIDVSGANNLDQAGIHTYFSRKFDKDAFDKLYGKTAEYGWDTVIYHYLSALWFLNKPDIPAARQACYRAGLAFGATSAANRNVLGRYGLPFDRINHLREYIDLGEHKSARSIGYNDGQEVKGYAGYSDAGLSSVPAFPWPPPQASTQYVLPKNLFSKLNTLGDADAKISAALSACGYYEKSYFRVPEGFALVTRLEQFNEDGSCKASNDRWNVTLKPSSFDLSDYFRALFWGRKGRYRILVFVVSSRPFSQGSATVTEGAAVQWLKTGMNYLPATIAGQALTGHICTALVYEFELTETLTEPRFLKSGTQPGQVHIEKSGIGNRMN